jgi:glycosyltransferase involved in cell wall biosynthesis
MTSVCIDCCMLDASGIGTYIRALVPRIIRIRPEWHFTLVGPHVALEQAGWKESGFAEVIDCDAPVYSLAEQLVMPRRIPAGTDLFWSPHYVVPLAYGGRMMVTVHDVLHLALPEYASGLLKRVYAHVMFAAVRRKASAVICVSDFTVSELTRLTRPSGQIVRRIYNGVDSSWFIPEAKPSPRARPYLLYVGNVKPHKNLRTLVSAFARVSGGMAEDLVIVGKREGFITGDTEIAAQAGELGDRVVFTGHVTDDLLHLLVAHATALVFPSLYEGFGLPPIEAMAAGCPVLASNAASIPEVCGDAALYCDPRSVDDMAAKLVQITQDGDLRHELVRRGLSRASLFSWQRCAKETVAFMEEVLAQ